MSSLDEWCFEFEITAPTPIPRPMADDLLCAEAVGWAEAHGLGIGGGCRSVLPEIGGAALAWRFRFGLCATGDCQTIPESQAGQLRDRLRARCESHGLSFAGGYRAFTPAEFGPDAEPGAAPDRL